MHPNPSRCRRNAKGASDLFVGQVEIKAEDEHKPRLGIEASQCPSKLLGLVRVGARRCLLLVTRSETFEEEPYPTAPRHAAFIRNYGQEPGPRLGPSAKGGALPPCFQGSLLDRVLGVVTVSQHPRCKAKRDWKQGFDGACEGNLVIKCESCPARACSYQEGPATGQFRIHLLCGEGSFRYPIWDGAAGPGPHEYAVGELGMRRTSSEQKRVEATLAVPYADSPRFLSPPSPVVCQTTVSVYESGRLHTFFTLNPPGASMFSPCPSGAGSGSGTLR